MLIQGVFSAVGFLLLLSQAILLRAEPLPPGYCFNFSKKVTTPLQSMISEVSLTDLTASGQKQGSADSHWGAARGIINASIREVLGLLKDHNTTKSPKVAADDMKVEELNDPNYLARQIVAFHLVPFPFINIDWKEEWAYALAEGTEKEPSLVMISYQKVDGTSHIKHLCGSMELKKSGPNQTDLYQYEEVSASRRSIEDTVKGLLGTLNTLREKIKNKVI